MTGTDLFWALAERWPSRRTGLAQAPSTGDQSTSGPLRLGLEDEAGPGWALTGTAAALAYGAPVAARFDPALDFYLPDQSVLRRATTLLGAAGSPDSAPATVRVAPVAAAVTRRLTNPVPPDTTAKSGRTATATGTSWAGWLLTHPLFVALNLSQDHGRGREILASWTPSEGTRVW